MKLKAVLFDLDGTLLPMDQDLFVKTYFGLLAKKAAPRGYEAKQLVKTIWAGTDAMVKNDGNKTNEEVFWEVFTQVYGPEKIADKALFEDFYANEFSGARTVCGFHAQAAQVVALVKELGLTAILATNPLFPAIATQNRTRWAGLQPEDFAWITTYENCRASKPNLLYYRQILEKFNLQPEECLMVGNDVGEDMVTAALGMHTFLLTDCLINKTGEDIEKYPHGSFPELVDYLRTLAK